MTCESCRAEHEEQYEVTGDETALDTECDRTGEPCWMQRVRLLPENLMAWELFQLGRSGDVGRIIWDLKTVRLTESEAGDLAMKIAVLASEQNRIDIEDAKRREMEARIKAK